MVDIARDPRWGRVAESLGEDPYLAGALAAAMVRGFQGRSLADPVSMAACVKHFAGYGAAEAGRDYNSVWLPEILLREVYLPPFRAALDAGAASFMTAFNALNGVPATGNRFLLRDILRGEWHYDGLVVSDYTAIHRDDRARLCGRPAGCRGQSDGRGCRYGNGEHRVLRPSEAACGERKGQRERD